MTIPPQFATPDLEALRDKVIADGSKMFEYARMGPEDFRVLGMFVQLYNSMELNLRRCVEVFGVAEKLSPGYQKRWRKLATRDLIPSIKDVVNGMGSIEPIPDTLGKLDEIELRRGWRNMIAHWAARRIPNEDALVFITKDDRDGAQAMGKSIQTAHVQFAILMLPDLRGLVLHLLEYDKWLGIKTGEWYKRYMPRDAPP